MTQKTVTVNFLREFWLFKFFVVVELPHSFEARRGSARLGSARLFSRAQWCAQVTGSHISTLNLLLQRGQQLCFTSSFEEDSLVHAKVPWTKFC
jgi:hypothetical protein